MAAASYRPPKRRQKRRPSAPQRRFVLLLLLLGATLLWSMSIGLVLETQWFRQNNHAWISSSTSAFAYAFLVAGCHHHDRSACQGMLANVMVATDILHTSGSTAEVLVLVQMAANGGTELSLQDQTMLSALGIKVHYLDPPKANDVVNFYSVQMLKFHVWNLTDYDRILYLDADIMPFCNLDYFFTATRRKSMIWEWVKEPAHGGIFLVTPNANDYAEIQTILEKHQQKISSRMVGDNNATTPSISFDPVVGWGHAFDQDDPWLSMYTQGTVWDWYGAFADQGFLYYYTKYVQRDVTIVHRRYTQDWEAASNDDKSPNVQALPKDHRFRYASCLPYQMDEPNHYATNRPFLVGMSAYRDWVHFSGKTKPWSKRVPRTLPKGASSVGSPLEYWWHRLQDVSARYNISILTEDNSSNVAPYGWTVTQGQAAKAASMAS